MKRLFKLAVVLLAVAFGVAMPAKAETKKILVVGNSFSFDATLQELLPIVQAGGDDIVLGFPYKGGTTLKLHMQYINGNEQIYNYYKIAAGQMTSTGGSSRTFSPEIIASEPWDAVVIQTDHNYSGSYQEYFPYLTDLMSYIKANLTNQDAKFYLYMTWAYQQGSSKLQELINKGLYTDQADMYAKILDCAQRAAVQAGIGIENIIPGGTAVQNGRTSYIGDNYNRDGYHMNMAHGRYTVALTWYEKLFGKSVIDFPYHPASVTSYCAKMCQTAAHSAVQNPFEVTSLADEFGSKPVTPGVNEDPWDGESVFEPVKDATGAYVVYTGAELAWIAQQVNSGVAVMDVKLGGDIDLGGKSWTPIGYGQAFNGTFDGQGFRIRNLYINRSDCDNNTKSLGLFAYTNNTACNISNLYLSGEITIPAGMTAAPLVGSIVGKVNSFGTMTNCHSDVTININGGFSYVGGLVGQIKQSSYSQCSYSGTINVFNSGTGSKGIGGLIGSSNSSAKNQTVTVDGCYFNGAIINHNASSWLYTGGIDSYCNLSGTGSTTNMNNSYSVGRMDTGATNFGALYGKTGSTTFKNANNYCLDSYTMTVKRATPMSIEQFNSGEVAYLLNGDQTDLLYGQDLTDPASMPEVYLEHYRVFKTIFMKDDAQYAVLYNNAELRVPDPANDSQPLYWVDAAGNYYSNLSVVDRDLTLYATTVASIGNIAADAQAKAEYFNLQGIRVDNPAQGLYIRRQGNTAKLVKL